MNKKDQDFIQYGNSKGLTPIWALTFSFLLIGLISLISGCEQKAQYGCDCYTGHVKASKTVIVSPDNLEEEYSTYDKSGALDAEAACHADMWLTFRWANNELAKTDVRPPITYEFETLFGYFPSNLGMETIYTTNEGIKEYSININEAEDKNLPDGTSYGVWVSYVEDYVEEVGSVICEIEIFYNVYNEEFWTAGCIK